MVWNNKVIQSVDNLRQYVLLNQLEDFEYGNNKFELQRKRLNRKEVLCKNDPQTDFMEFQKCSVIVCLGQTYLGIDGFYVY